MLKGPLTTGKVLAIVGAVVAVFLIFGVLSSFGGVDDSKDTAKIEDVGSISKNTFNHWYLVVAKQPQPGQKKPKPPPPLKSKQGEALKQQVMQFLISSDWIEGEAKERGISASSEEIQKQFVQTKKQSFPNEKAYQRFLKTSGQTLQDLLFRVRLDVLSNKIREDVTKGTSDVSEGDVKDYYEKNAQQFSQPERRDLEVILTKSQANANKAKQEVASGKKWSDVAKQLSTDPASKNQGGKLLGVTKGQQDPAFDAAIFAAVKGKIAGPVKTGAGFYVFRVNKITPATKQSLQASTAGIRQLLVSQNQQKKLDQFATTFRSDWRAKTDCAPDYVIPDCRNGREESQTTPPPTVPGQKKPIPGAAGAAPPALDGTGSSLAAGAKSGGDTVIGIDTQQGAAAAALGAPGGGQTQSAALALGGAPKKGGGGLPAGFPSGAIPGGGGSVPQGGAQQGGAQQGGAQGGSAP
jgi:parvulin-like peptidyl-prolyl isomerase